MVNQTITEGVIRTRTKLRRDLLISILDEFDGSIMALSHIDRAEKYGKMAQSAFSFYRGSAYLFYFDTTRQYFPYHSAPERPTWIQGDLHFENFGAFRSEDGDIVYDVNDFDEGYVGSYLYDLLRMAVSIALVGRQLGYGGAEQQSFIAGYAKPMRGKSAASARVRMIPLITQWMRITPGARSKSCCASWKNAGRATFWRRLPPTCRAAGCFWRMPSC